MIQKEIRRERYEFGKHVEEAACKYLLSAPSTRRRLVERNYRWVGGEIDLIFEETRGDGEIELVFVEVRARRSGSWTSGLESVTVPKQLRWARTIRRYLASYSGRARHVRLDILDWDGAKWSWYQNLEIAGAN